MDTILQQLPPVSKPDAEILILGSMNGRSSLCYEQYYHYHTNKFWKLMTQILGAPSRTKENYDERIEFLKNNKIALWGSIETCTRSNNGRGTSLDSDIRNVTHADLFGFLDEHLEIRKILFNGRVSKLYFDEYLKLYFDEYPMNKQLRCKFEKIEQICVSSSSDSNDYFNCDTWCDALKG